MKIGDRVNLRIIDVIYNGRHIMLARKMGVGGGRASLIVYPPHPRKGGTEKLKKSYFFFKN